MNIAHRKGWGRGLRWKARVVELYFAWKDPATPFYAKGIIALAMLYLISPVDLIPDFIPIAGWLDDLVIVPLLLSFALHSLPTRARQRSQGKAIRFSKQAGIVFWVGITFILLIILAWLFPWLKGLNG